MWAIFKKEWLSNFRTMTGWIFLAVTIFFLGWYFRYYGLQSGLPYLSYILDAALFIFLFTMPLITMRCFSEEKRHRTDQLLFTSPVPVVKIVLGKYLASVCVFLPVFTVLLIYPLLMRIYGEVPLAENLLALFSFCFFGLTALAIGVLISALTENQIIAAVLTFFVLLLSAMTGAINAMISREGNLLTRALSFLDLTAPFEDSLYGTFVWSDYVYYLSIIALALFLTVQSLTVRRSKGSRGVAIGVFSGVAKVVLAFAAVIALNALCRLVPAEYRNADLTYNGIRSITEESKQTLHALDRGVQIHVLSKREDADETLATTLERMRECSGLLKVDYIDPKEQPYFYLDYVEEEPTAGSLIVVSGDNSRVVNYYDCYQVSYDYAYDVSVGSYVPTEYRVSGYDGEGRIMSAIRHVTSGDVMKILCIGGHQEYEMEDELKGRIANAGYDLESLNLLKHPALPEDGDILFLLAPVEDLNDADLEKIRAFLGQGKGAILITGYTEGTDTPNYDALLSDFGMEVLPGLVMETDPAYYNEKEEFLLPEIVQTPYTGNIYTEGRTRFIYMPFARGIRLKETADVTGTTFLRTTEGAYVKTGRDIEKGPFSLGVYTERHGEGGTVRMAVFSADYFLYPDINLAANGSNYELFMKLLSKVSETDELTDVPVKPYRYDPILVGPTARDIFSFLLIGVIPGAILLVGIGIWYYRRKN
ncbi:MAG: Gldg family protein [Lachnospiraceae bacterium]|nr:Gldg family protein [Lachnospiraceae bacterium]